MSDEHLARALEVFREVCELDGDERSRFLDDRCGGDAALRAEVESMLFWDDVDDDDSSPLDVAVAAIAQEPSASVPVRVGDFRVIRELGHGGMGRVYLADQSHPRRRVAVKVMRQGLDTTQLERRFRLEIKVLGGLRHPGLAQVYEADVGTVEFSDGSSIRLPYFAMEYVEGRTLDAHIRNNELSMREVLRLFAEICDAVEHAHAAGVVHRDLKPANILVDDQHGPRVLDFGVARVGDGNMRTRSFETAAGQLVGTLPYMSPEQVSEDSSDIDARTDVYSLGVVLYEALSGRLPYHVDGVPIVQAARIIQLEEPELLGARESRLRGDVETIVAKALEKDKARRYGSAGELATDLRRFLGSEPITARPASRIYQLKKLVSRHRGLTAALSLTLLVLVAGIVTSTLFGLRAARNEAEVRRLNEDLRFRLYVAAIERAEAAALAADPVVTRRTLLDLTERRGWEWHHLLARVHLLEQTEARSSRWFAFLDDGRIVGTGKGGARLTDVVTGETLREFGGPGIETSCLSEDGTVIGGMDERRKEVSFWRVSDGTLIRRLSWDTGGWWNWNINRDGSLVSLASMAGLRLLETGSGRVVFERAGTHLSGTFSHDGRRFLTLSAYDESLDIRLHDVADGSLLAEAKRPEGTLFGRAFSPDGRRVALRLDGAVHVLDARTLASEPPLELRYKGGYGLAFLGSTRLAVVGDSSYAIWDIETRQRESRKTFALRIADLCVSPCRSLVVIAGVDGTQIDFGPFSATKVLRGHEGFAYAAAFGPDGTMVASGAWDGTVRIWDALDGRLLRVLETIPNGVPADENGDVLESDIVESVAILPGGREAIAWALGAYRWDLFTGRCTSEPWSLEEYCERLPAGGRFASRAVSPDGNVLLRLEGEDAVVLDRASGRERRLDFAPGSSPHVVAMSHDNLSFAVGDGKGTIRVLSLEDGRPVHTFHSGGREVFSLCFSPDGSRLAVGGRSSTLQLFDLERGKMVAALSGHGTYIKAVAFSPDGTQIVSSSGDRTVRLWDVRGGARIYVEAMRARKLRQQLEPHVERLLEATGDPSLVYSRLLEAPPIDDAAVPAALRWLLTREYGVR